MTGFLPRALRANHCSVPRVLAVSAARELGMSDDAIDYATERHGWQRLTRGMLLTVPGTPSRADWINVGLELAAPTGAISGWDALRIVGLGERNPPTDEVLILSRSGHHRVIGQARIRPTRRAFSTWMLPGEHPDHPYAEVVRTARAVADTALQYRRFQPVRALVTSSVQQRQCAVEELIAELEAGPRNGSAWLRRAVADARGGAKSIAEAEAIDALRGSPLPPFEANVPIMTASGVLIAEADVLWRELRGVLEVNGRRYHFSEDDWENTMKRHGVLSRRQLSVTHSSPSAIRSDPRAWARGVEQWLRARCAELRIAYRPVRDPLRIPAVPGCPQPFVVPDLLG
jgi:hypothetical protein